MNKRIIFSGKKESCIKVAMKLGIPMEEFRFYDITIPSNLYGYDRGTTVLFLCGLPMSGLIRAHFDFYKVLKTYDIPAFEVN